MLRKGIDRLTRLILAVHDGSMLQGLLEPDNIAFSFDSERGVRT